MHHRILPTLSLLLTTTTAFIPFNPSLPLPDSSQDEIQILPVPSNLDTNIWIPIATYTHPISVSPTPTPSTHEEIKRQGAPVVAPAPAATAVGNDQVSPITTYQIQSGAQQIDVVYTQTFGGVPDQWPSPSAGSIGLGTIVGQVGVVKSKRSVETDAPQVERRGGDGSSGDGGSGSGDIDREGKKSGSSGKSNGASEMRVSTFTAIVAGVLGLLMI